MKKLFFCSVILLLSMYLPAQNRSIAFETDSDFATALARAKESGKLLFMDCYTSWCGPCKVLATKVFTVDSVADFFNAHFVSLKMDMEQGEGVQLKEKYQIEAYPTLLLINGEGENVFRSVGGCSAPELLARVRQGMNPENSLQMLGEKFNAGNREPEFVGKYCAALKKGFESDRLKVVVHEYFRNMNISAICQEANWNIYDAYVQDINDSLYHRMIVNNADFSALRGDSLIDKKLSDAYGGVIFGSISGASLPEELYRQYCKDLKAMNLQDSSGIFYLNSYLELARLKAVKQYDQLLDVIDAGPVGYSPERKMTLTMSLVFLADGTREQRMRGLKLLGREVRAYMERGELSPELSNVLEYVQSRMMGEDIELNK